MDALTKFKNALDEVGFRLIWSTHRVNAGRVRQVDRFSLYARGPKSILLHQFYDHEDELLGFEVYRPIAKGVDVQSTIDALKVYASEES